MPRAKDRTPWAPETRKPGYGAAFPPVPSLRVGSEGGKASRSSSGVLSLRNILDVCFGYSLMNFRSSAALTMTLF